LNWVIAIGCAATLLGIFIWISWHSLDELIQLGLMEIDLKGDDGVDD
jgi:hypothetical protein